MSNYKPNFFFTFKLNNQDLLDNLRKIQHELLARNKDLQKYLEPVETAHLTLNVFYADSEVITSLKTQIASSISTLQGKIEVQEIEFQGLGMFRNSVLWAAPVKGTEFLHRLYDLMENVLAENKCKSILPSFIPHVTLFKSNEVDMKISTDDIGIHKMFGIFLKYLFISKHFQKCFKILRMELI